MFSAVGTADLKIRHVLSGGHNGYKNRTCSQRWAPCEGGGREQRPSLEDADWQSWAWALLPLHPRHFLKCPPLYILRMRSVLDFPASVYSAHAQCPGLPAPV